MVRRRAHRTPPRSLQGGDAIGENVATADKDTHGVRLLVAADAQDAAKLFEEQARLILPHGGSGQAIWFGTADNPEVLRVDIDVDAGRAALRWLPDGSHAVARELGQTITVLENPDWGPVTIPAELARVSAATAHTAVVEYVATGNRPTCVEWQS
jgi:hypothetical protein